jgi:hypothetical protein
MANRKPQLFDRWESPEIIATILAWADNLDRCYAEAAKFDAARAAESDSGEESESFDPARDGWIGKDGRP